MYEPPPHQNPKSHKRWVFLFLLACIVLLGIGLVIVYFAYADEIGVIVVRIDGTMITGDQYGDDFTGSEVVGKELRSAADDPMVEAIVLRINSPGGTPAAAQEIIRDLDYAKEKKPVVVSMGDMATSAAYYVCVHADRIYANPDTLTAGIGTMWTFRDISKWMGKEGYTIDIVKSGSKKDMGSDARPLSDEERAYAQKIVNESFETFINDILMQRNISRSEIEDARVIRGEEALRLGIVDEMGNINDAINGARELARIKSSRSAVLS
jgi:protease-4